MANTFDRMGDLIAELKQPDAIDNAGPESATESPKLTPKQLDNMSLVQLLTAAMEDLIADLKKSVKERNMTRRQIEVAAREAEDALTERSERLDQREADLSGKIEDYDQQIIDLNKQLDECTTCLRLADGRAKALDIARDDWEGMANSFSHKLDVEIDCRRAVDKQLDAATELVSKVEDERDDANRQRGEAIVQRDRAIANTADPHKQMRAAYDRLEEARGERDSAMARADNALRQAERAKDSAGALREAILVAIEGTQNMVSYCGSTLALLRAADTEIERETHGTDSRV